MSSTQTPLIVSCPSCKKSLRWTSDNPFRPFCCERCKLIDLGEWADGGHAIPGETLPESADDSEN
ncbi:MAG: DNA gyrase inhibitor YacG [Gammaproteobacteria bacterium]|nr:DNA gyrase inhibitor YacG [Gammaproteobacteria bacterium]